MPSRNRGGIVAERLIFDLSYVMQSTQNASAGDIVLDDVRLVRKMADGDAAALGSFYDKWSSRVYATVIAIVRSAQDAEEVVDDCFWQAWNQAARFEPGRGQVQSWILNIARTRALDKLKAAKRRREEQLESAPAEVFATEFETDTRLDQEQRATVVTTALKTLPAAQREVLEMAYYGGLSQTQIAESTGEALGTIKTRIRLGMQKLRETLGPLERMTS